MMAEEEHDGNQEKDNTYCKPSLQRIEGEEMLQGKFRFAANNMLLGDMDAFFRIYLCDGLVQNALQYAGLYRGDYQTGGDVYRGIGDDIEVGVENQRAVDFQRGIANEGEIAFFILNKTDGFTAGCVGFDKIPLGEFLFEIRKDGWFRPGNDQRNPFCS